MKLVSCLALAALFTTAASEEVSPTAFAISCRGTSSLEDTVTGNVLRRSMPMPQQIFVFDPASKRVQRALTPRQEFDDVCSSKKGQRFVSFSPGLITVNNDDDESQCSFSADRQSGKATFSLKLLFPGDRYRHATWTLTCQRAVVPVFDVSRNKF